MCLEKSQCSKVHSSYHAPSLHIHLIIPRFYTQKIWRSGSSLHVLKFYTNWLPTDNSTLLSSLVANVSNHNIFPKFLAYQEFSFLRDKSSSLIAQIMIISEKVFSKVKLNWRLFQVFPKPTQQLQKWVWHRHGKGNTTECWETHTHLPDTYRKHRKTQSCSC